MTVARDMDPPLTALARLRVALAQDPACRSHVAVLGACLATLEDCSERAEALDRAALPPHFLKQRVPLFDELRGGSVVSLMEARLARETARRARL